MLASNAPLQDRTASAANRFAVLGQDALQAFIWLAVITACFILTHPYTGVRHDNVLYLAQALLRTNPEIYGGDPFFQWGSQDRYTLFSPIYSWFIAYLGFEKATIALVLLSQALFLAGSFALVRVVVPQGLRGFAMLFVVCTVGLYGGRLIFRMAEPFVTPRPFVEAAILFAIALLISRRHGWALVLIAVGALLHPLIAIAGAFFWWVYLLLEDKRWWWLLSLLIIPVTAGLAGLSPFNQLFQSFDKTWLDILLVDNANVFITQWTHIDWNMVVFDAVVLFIAAYFAGGVAQRVYKAALITLAATLGGTFIFADLLHNVLLTSIQPWRALWIVHWLAAASLPFVLLRLWKEGGACRIAAGLLLFGFVTRGLLVSLAASVIGVLLYHYRDRVTLRPRLVNIVLCALGGGVFINWLGIALRAYQFTSNHSVDPVMDFAIQSLSKPLPLLLFGTALIWFGVVRPYRVRTAAFVAAGVLALAVTLWDQRPPYWRYMESVPLGSHPFSAFVTPDQEVLWHGNATAPWIMMQRRSFFSDMQKAGQIFNRDMALEFKRRREAIAPLMVQDEICSYLNNLKRRKDSCQPNPETVREVCRNAMDLDFIVLETGIANKWLASWAWPIPVGGPPVQYYLYGCKTWREG